MSQKKVREIRKKNEIVVIPEKKIVKDFFGIIKENWKFLIILLSGTFLIYSNSLHGDFVSDDYASIPQNKQILDLKIMGKVLSSLHTWLIATFFGTNNPNPYHTFNLILYLFICILVFVFVYLLFGKKKAILTSVLFSVLPIHVESVSWISGKPYLFVAFFLLLDLIIFILYLKTANKKYLWIEFITLSLTFYSDLIRTSALVLLVILVLLSFQSQFVVKIKWKKILLFLGLTLAVVIFTAWPLILGRIDSVNSGYNSSGTIFYNPFFQYPTAITKYLQLLLIPIDLTLYHTMYILPIWLNWAIILTYLALLIVSFIKDKRIFFAAAFIFLATAPSMAPVKVSWLVAERYIFLGSLGFCLLLVIIFENLAEKSRIIKWLVYGLFVFFIVFYSTKTFIRNNDWKTNHALWVKTVQVSPNSHNAWNNIGDDYDKLKQYENSIKGFTQSVVVKPDYADAYHNRANILAKIGRLDLARESYETALKFSPGLFQTYISLVQMDLYEKKDDLALIHAQKIIKIQPNAPQSYYILSAVYLQIGKKEEAKNLLQQIVSQFPDYVQARELLKSLN